MTIFSTNEPEPWPSADEDTCPTCGYTDKDWKGEAACTDKWHYFRPAADRNLREVATNILHWLDNLDQATFDMPTLREDLRKSVESELGAAEYEIGELKAALSFALEFIQEPEWFPNEGDRQFWRERKQCALALVTGV